MPHTETTDHMIDSPLPRVLVCGSRSWTDRALIARVLPSYGPAVIVHGAAQGADRIAAGVAEQLRWPVEPYPADWQRYRRSAGPRRNLEMLDTRPVLVIAFTVIAGGTPGTCHTLTNAYRRGIPLVIVTPDGHVTTYTPTQPHGKQGRGSHAPASGDTPLSDATQPPTPKGDTR